MSNLLPIRHPAAQPPAPGMLQVIAYPSPFRTARDILRLSPGPTLQELLEQVQPNPTFWPLAHISIDGLATPRDMWAHTIPKPGSIVVIKIVPGNAIAKIFVAIAAIIAAVFIPPLLGFAAGTLGAGLVGGLIGMSVGIVGNLLVNALVPPPSPRSEGASPGSPEQKDSTTYFLEGSRNQIVPWGSVPALLGYLRIVPNKLAMDYSEALGAHQYVRCLFGQYGPLQIESVKVGSTDIGKLAGVTAEYRNCTTVLSNQTIAIAKTRDPISIKLSRTAGSWISDGVAAGCTLTLAGCKHAGNNIAYLISKVTDKVLTSPWGPFVEPGPPPPVITPEPGTGHQTATIVHGSNPLTLYTRDVHEEGLSVELKNNHPHVQTADAGANYLSVDITFQALYQQDSTSQQTGGPPRQPLSIRFKVEYRDNAGGSWKTVYPQAAVKPLTGSADGFERIDAWGLDWDDAEIDDEGSENGDPKTGAWIITGCSSSALRRGLYWRVNPSITYDVRLTRIWPDDNGFSQSQSYWTALRSFKDSAPVQFPGTLAEVAVRIQASEQLNGTLDEYNFEGKSIFPDWDADSRTWIARATNNPASLFRAVLQSEAAPIDIPDSKVDLVQLQRWHSKCVDERWTYNRNIDQRENWFDLLREIASAGRAAPSDYDVKVSVVMDEPQAGRGIPLNPRAVKDVEVELLYPDLPHGFRCPFKNEAKDCQDDERIVLDDGWSQLNPAGTLRVDAWGRSAVRVITNGGAAIDVGDGVVGIPCPGHGLRSGWTIDITGTVNYNDQFTVLASTTTDQIDIRATFIAETFGPDAQASMALAIKFEQLALPGTTTASLIFRRARYHLADARLRYRRISFLTNVQNLVFVRGDKIDFAHDVMLNQLASGFVKALHYNITGTDPETGEPVYGSDIIGITLDNYMVMEAGGAYGLVFRSISPRATLNYRVTTVPGEWNRVDFADPITLEEMRPSMGDLATFGVFGEEGIPAIVTDIQQRSGFWSRVTLMDEAPEIHLADRGLIPEHESNITVPAEWWRPTINDIRSGGDVLYRAVGGSWRSRILVTYERFTAEKEEIREIQCQYWEEGNIHGTARLVSAQFADGEISLLDIEDRLTYKMRFRFLKYSGLKGPWTDVYTHTVEGKTAPPSDVANFQVAQFQNVLCASWSPVPDLDLKGYEIRIGEQGIAWDNATRLTGAYSGTAFTSGDVEEGTWDLLIKARDTSGNYSENAARKTVVVYQFYFVLSSIEHAPWLSGTPVNCQRNPQTGNINPSMQAASIDHYFDILDNYCYNPYPSYSYTAPEVDLSSDKDVRVWAKTIANLPPGETGSQAPQLYIDYHLDGGAYDGWELWTIGPIEACNVKAKIEQVSANGLYRITGFCPVIDQAA
jgi:hypothetical protein